MILFSPTGKVHNLYDANAYTPPASPIYLLLGRREGMTDVNTGSDPKNPLNINDLTNIWIAINNQSGQVTTAENAGPVSATNPNGPRAFAQSGQSMGGR